MLSGRDALLANYPDYFQSDTGVALTWLEPWDGTDPLDLRALDPYFIEICRRVRLTSSNGGITARSAASRAPRISAKMAGGNVGDFWTPVRVADGKALSLSAVGFRYDRLADLILDSKVYQGTPAMQVAAEKGARWRLVARGVAAGQGKTEGYHERGDIAFSTATVRILSRVDRRDVLARFAKEQIEEVAEVTRALRFGIAVAAGGGRDANELNKAHRSHADPYSRRLDREADARFFSALEERNTASATGDEAVAACRAAFVWTLIRAAEALLTEAVETVPCPSIQRPRARARAASAFWGRLRNPKSGFSEILSAREADNAA
jgi:CRISPR system Cascade subunit CasA